VQCYREAIIRLEASWRHRLACPREAACRPAVKCYRPRQTTDDDRYHRTKQYWSIRRACNGQKHSSTVSILSVCVCPCLRGLSPPRRTYFHQVALLKQTCIVYAVDLYSRAIVTNVTVVAICWLMNETFSWKKIHHLISGYRAHINSPGYSSVTSVKYWANAVAVLYR